MQSLFKDVLSFQKIEKYNNNNRNCFTNHDERTFGRSAKYRS